MDVVYAGGGRQGRGGCCPWCPQKGAILTSKHLNNSNTTNCLTLSSDFSFGCQGKVDVEFKNEVKTLIRIKTEKRIRRASGPVHSLPLIP